MRRVSSSSGVHGSRSSFAVLQIYIRMMFD